MRDKQTVKTFRTRDILKHDIPYIRMISIGGRRGAGMAMNRTSLIIRFDVALLEQTC